MPKKRLVNVRVFFSYNRVDRSAVEYIANKLHPNGVDVWLDQWNLIPGDPWLQKIEKALAECDTCAVFVGAQGTGPWQHAEMSAAIQRRITSPGFRVIPAFLPGATAEPCALSMFLMTGHSVRFASLEDENALQLLVAGIRGVATKPQPTCISPRIVFEFVISGSSYDKHKIEVIFEHLRKLSLDADLTLKAVKDGSIVLVIDGNAASYQRLKHLFDQGVLSNVLGASVQGLRLLSAASTGENRGASTFSEGTTVQLDLIRRIPLFRDLSVDECLALIRGSSNVLLARNGFQIFKEGEPADFVIVLLSGRASMSLASADNQIIVRVIESFEVTGENDVFEARFRTATLTAIAETRYLKVSAAVFREYLHSNPAFARAVASDLANYNRQTMEQLRVLALYDANERVMWALKQLGRRQTRTRDGAIVFDQSPTKEIAGMTACSRETVARVLTKLKNRGTVVSDGRRLFVKMPPESDRASIRTDSVPVDDQ